MSLPPLLHLHLQRRAKQKEINPFVKVQEPRGSEEPNKVSKMGRSEKSQLPLYKVTHQAGSSTCPTHSQCLNSGLPYLIPIIYHLNLEIYEQNWSSFYLPSLFGKLPHQSSNCCHDGSGREGGGRGLTSECGGSW